MAKKKMSGGRGKLAYSALYCHGYSNVRSWGGGGGGGGLSVMEIPHLVQVMGGGRGGGGNRSPLTMAVVVCMTDDGG